MIAGRFFYYRTRTKYGSNFLGCSIGNDSIAQKARACVRENHISGSALFWGFHKLGFLLSARPKTR